MTRVRALCDSAWGDGLPERDRDRTEIPNYRGEEQLDFRLQYLACSTYLAMAPRAIGFVCNAAFVYAPDQLVSRGGPTDVMGTAWYRTLGLIVPVQDPEFWGDT